MKTAAIDYINAAIATAEPAPEGAAPVPEAPAPVEEQPVELEAPPPADDVPEAPPVVKTEAPPVPKPVDRVTKGFEDLARDRAALRAEQAKFKADQISPEDRALLAAAKSGSAMSLLAAARIPWSQAAQEVLDGTKPTKKYEAPPEPDERDKRLAALEQEISSRKAAETRHNVMSQLQAKTKAGATKFKLTAQLGEEEKAIRFIEQHFNRYGELPGETLEESMEIALEAVEMQLVKEKKRWDSLTAPKGMVTNPPKAEVPAVGAVSQQAPKTLTNQTGSGPSKVPVQSPKAKTSEDYVNAAILAATAQ